MHIHATWCTGLGAKGTSIAAITIPAARRAPAGPRLGRAARHPVLPSMVCGPALCAWCMQIMVASTGACLAAARFGLAPSVKKQATAGLKLVEGKSSTGVLSKDPAGEQPVRMQACADACNQRMCIGAHARHALPEGGEGCTVSYPVDWPIEQQIHAGGGGGAQAHVND